MKVWVVEAGAEATRGTEEVHTVTVTLGTPVTRDGRPVRVRRRSVDGPDRWAMAGIPISRRVEALGWTADGELSVVTDVE
nr:trypco2 family protein [Nonomuraea sp. K271]